MYKTTRNIKTTISDSQCNLNLLTFNWERIFSVPTTKTVVFFPLRRSNKASMEGRGIWDGSREEVCEVLPISSTYNGEKKEFVILFLNS